MEIRPEHPGEEKAIAEINRHAFAGEEEVGIVAGISVLREGYPYLEVLALAPMVAGLVPDALNERGGMIRFSPPFNMP